MTINEVAETLTRCADSECDDCKYNTEPCVIDCQAMLIRDMGVEVRKIAEEMEKDEND